MIIMLFLQVLGSHHFHLLAFHVIQGNQVIVRGEKRKTVESVLNCLKVSCIEIKHFRTNRHFIRLSVRPSLFSFFRSFVRLYFFLAVVCWVNFGNWLTDSYTVHLFWLFFVRFLYQVVAVHVFHTLQSTRYKIKHSSFSWKSKPRPLVAHKYLIHLL